eukprot:1157433-Pelagomonas_calceolata.AAC.6
MVVSGLSRCKTAKWGQACDHVACGCECTATHDIKCRHKCDQTMKDDFISKEMTMPMAGYGDTQLLELRRHFGCQ